MNRILILLASLAFSACSTAVNVAQAQEVYTGIDMLASYGFEELRGKRVGLVTNPSGVDRKFFLKKLSL